MTTGNTWLREWLAKPLAVVSAVLAAVAHLFQFGPVDAFAATIWAQSGMLFTATSVATEKFAAMLPMVSTAQMETASTILGLVFIAKILDETWDGLAHRLNNDSE